MLSFRLQLFYLHGWLGPEMFWHNGVRAQNKLEAWKGTKVSLRWFTTQHPTSACYCYTLDSDICNLAGLISTRIWVIYHCPHDPSPSYLLPTFNPLLPLFLVPLSVTDTFCCLNLFCRQAQSQQSRYDHLEYTVPAVCNFLLYSSVALLTLLVLLLID
jgi:hypothetical protein